MKLADLLEVAREARRSLDAADAAFAALPTERRREFLLRAVSSLGANDRRLVVTDLLLLDEADDGEPVVGSKPKPPTSDATDGATTEQGNPRERRGTSVDRVELFVLAHAEGVTTREVAEATNQEMPNTDNALRQAVKRGTIERRDNKWFPAAKKPSASGRRTIRTVIIEVMDASDGPLDSTDIWQAALKIEPKLVRGSFENEMNRLRKERLIKSVGTGGKHGSALYVRSNPEAQGDAV